MALPEASHLTEQQILESGLKWTPIKRYYCRMKRGVGKNSNWRLTLNSLLRPGATIPKDGVSFTLVITLRDIENSVNVYDEFRAQLINNGNRLSDITAVQELKV